MASGALTREQDVREAYSAHGPELYGFAVRSLGDAGLAEEAVQETFLRAWRAGERFDPQIGSLRTWLFAILDVTDPEPLPEGHPLWSAPGLLLTPHVAGSTAGAWTRAWAVAVRQIEAYAGGDHPPNLVAGPGAPAEGPRD